MDVCDFDWTAAEREFQRALKLNPDSADSRFLYGNEFLSAIGRVDESVRELQRAVEPDPISPLFIACLAGSLISQGQHEQAIAAAEEGTRICGRHQFLLMCPGDCYAAAGRIAEARQLLEELKTRRSAMNVSAFAVGSICLSLGEVDLGLDWFAQALDERGIPEVVMADHPFHAPCVLTRPSRPCCAG